MIIQKIEIKNFRSYYGNNVFDFSNGLTLIVGDNGDGKTTFFEALQWLLNTSPVVNNSIENFSEMRKSEMEIGEVEQVMVSMTFDHSGTKIIERYFAVEKTAADRFKLSDQVLKGYENKDSGRIPVDGKLLLTQCYDAFMQKFSMFKGESDLNVFNDKAAFQDMVKKFSDLRNFDMFVSFTEEFENKSNKAFLKESKSDTKISKAVERLDYQISEVRREISFKERDLKEYEKSATLYQGEIDKLADHKEDSQRYTEIKNRIAAKRSEAARLKGQIDMVDMNISLLDRMWILCAYPSILKEFQTKSSAFSKNKRAQNEQFIKEMAKQEGKLEAYNELTELVNGASRLPWYLPGEKEMEEMIHDHICKVCGREAPEGSDAYRFMCEKLEEHRRHALAEAQAKKPQESAGQELFKNSYVEEIHSLSLSLGGYNEGEVNGKATEIRDRIFLVNQLKEKLAVVEKDIADMEDDKNRIVIQANGISEELLDKSFHDLAGFFEQVRSAEKKASEISAELAILKEKRNILNSQLEALNPAQGQAKVYKRVHEAFEKIANAFKGAREKNLTSFLESLEEKSNDYLMRLNANDFHGIVKLIRTADNAAVIRLFSSNGVEIKKPSGSQQTTMYMSVLFAISDLATMKNDEKYPLIFDAATSSFGDAKEREFYNIIDGLKNGGHKKQCIIVTKDFLENSELKMDEIEKLTCSVYRIKKADGFNKNDLSTIRTLVEKIK